MDSRYHRYGRSTRRHGVKCTEHYMHRDGDRQATLHSLNKKIIYSLSYSKIKEEMFIFIYCADLLSLLFIFLYQENANQDIYWKI